MRLAHNFLIIILKIIKVDLTKEEELVPHLKGVEAVLSSLGGRGGIWMPCTVYTDTIPVIVGAMRRANVSRLVCVTAWGAKGILLYRCFNFYLSLL